MTVQASAAPAHVDSLPGYENRWRAMIFIGVALLVISLDNTILNVALPSISRSLGASASQLQWVVDSYVLVFASLLLTMGSLSDKMGRKRALQVGIALFGVGSIWCAVSQDTFMLIAARAFTGIGGAIIMPATLSIISASFPPVERPRAFAVWAAIFSLGVGIGPVTGGALLQVFHWNSVFLINIPIVILAIVGAYFFIAESRDDHAPPIDIPGVVLSILALFTLIYGIIEAGDLGWTDTQVIGAFAVGFVLLAVFAWWENHTPNAMLPIRFFKNRSFTVANLTLVMVTFSLLGFTFFITQYFQSVLGFTTLEAGLAALPVAITLTIVSYNSAAVAKRIGTKRTVALGAFLGGVALLYYRFILDVNTPYYLIALGQVIFASGLGLTFSPATNSVMQSVPVSKAGVGSAMNDTTRQLGGALGIAVLGTALNRVYRGEIMPLLDTLPQLPDAAREAILRSIQGAHVIAAQAPADIAQSIIQTSNLAFVDGTHNAITVGAGVLFAGALLALAFLPTHVQRHE